MFTFLLFLHSLLRWIILVLAIVAIYRSYRGMRAAKPFTAEDKKIGLFLMIAAHITLLIGIYQWIDGPWALGAVRVMGMKAVMHDPVYRFYTVEHSAAMLIAIVLITIGRRFGKTALPDAVKHKRTFWYYLIALLIILSSVPWPFIAAGMHRPWIRMQL